jgi:hypothetical protein
MSFLVYSSCHSSSSWKPERAVYGSSAVSQFDCSFLTCVKLYVGEEDMYELSAKPSDAGQICRISVISAYCGPVDSVLRKCQAFEEVQCVCLWVLLQP